MEMVKVECAYELLERTKHSDAIGHILADRREAQINTDPRLANAWQNMTSQATYAVQSWELDNESVAERLMGEGPERIPVTREIKRVLSYRYLELTKPPVKKFGDDDPNETDILIATDMGATREYFSLGEDFIDLQVNVVRDMHRSMQVKTRQWLVRFITDHAEGVLQCAAATMLAADITRKDGIKILALCHGNLFSKDLPEPPPIPHPSPINTEMKVAEDAVVIITDEDCRDDDELQSIVEQVRIAINNDLGIIKTEDDVVARFKLAQAAFDAVPDVGTDLPDPSTMPMDIFEQITVPRIAEDMVPSVLWKFAKSNSEQIGAAREAIAISSLFACTAAISDDVKIQPRSNATWVESPRIWAVLVGPPSSKKSPAASVAIKPLQKLDRQRAGVAAEKRAQYDLDMKVYKAQEAAYVKAAAKGDDVGDPPDRPEEPQAERLLMMDTTPEALVNIAINQTRGLALYRDELGGWFGSHDAYKSGGKGSKDIPFWLSAYNGDGWTVDRVSRSGGSASNVGTSIFGGIQPDALRELKLHQKRDGMLARFIPCFLSSDDGAVGQNVASDSHANNIYELLIEGLVDLTPLQLDGTNNGPVVCPGEIGEQIDSFLQDVMRLARLEGAVPDAMAEHLGKLEGMSYRLLLIYHCINTRNLWVEPISQDTCDRVLRFLRGFMLPSLDVLYNQVLARDANNHALVIAQKVGRLILAKQLTTFSLRNLQQNGNSWFPKADIEGNRIRYVVMNLLRDANWITPCSLDRETDHTQFRPHTHWITNPLIWDAMKEHQKSAEEDRKRGWELLQRNIADRKRDK